MQAKWIQYGPPGDPAAGLVEVRDLRRGELLPGDREEPVQAGRRVRQQRGQPTRRHRRSEGFLQALGGAFDRQVLTAQQVGRQRGDARAVTRRSGRLGGELRTRDRTTRALPSLGAVLDRDQLDHRQVEDLAHLGADHGRVGKVRSAPPTVGRSMGPDLIGHRPRLQPETLTALLLTGPAARRPAQRLRRRLRQSIAARRLRGVPRVLPQPCFQLRNPTRQRSNQRIALRQRDVPLREQHQQLLHRRSRRDSRHRQRIEHENTYPPGKSQYGQVKPPAAQAKISEPRRQGT